jgi:hypothetical protein
MLAALAICSAVLIPRSGLAANASEICKGAAAMPSGIGAPEVAALLDGLSGIYREQAINCLQPKLQQGLTGADLARIVGNGLPSRARMLCTVRAHARDGLTAAETAAALGGLTGIYREQAIRCLEPKIANNLNGLDIAQVVGVGTASRASMICDLKTHKQPLWNSAQLSLACSGSRSPAKGRMPSTSISRITLGRR